MSIQAHRGEILHFLGNPGNHGAEVIEYFEDGVLIIEGGLVQTVGEADSVLGSIPGQFKVIDHPNSLIVPGMVDTHVHFSQCEVIAAYGAQLLEWLEQHTFPAESRFSDPRHSLDQATFFLEQLLRNGTTTALVFGTVHAESADAFFQVAEQQNLRMICGKVMMDRNAPDYIIDTPESSYQDSRRLIEKWHNKGRLGYAVTPRFAPTSSPEQLNAAGKLLDEFPDVHLHTHLSENTRECEWVAELFPNSQNYLDVYDQHNLLGPRSVFAHSIHLSESEWSRLSGTGSNVAHCPMSNLFIGSGLFSYQDAVAHDVNVGLGTDVGGGDSFSILRTINEAYKVQQLLGQNLSPYQSLYLATLGGATALDLQNKIGNFETGKEADFIVLDYTATPLIQFRMASCKDLMEKLFVLEMLGDDRAIRETWIMGEKRYQKS